MDEQLPTIISVWEPDETVSVRSRTLENPLRKSGRKIQKETLLQDAEGVYHAIGGFQRFVHTANEHPQWFYNRFLVPGILLPTEKQEIDMTVHIHPALTRSALDGEYTEVPANGELDQGRDQAPGSAAQGARGAGGPEDTTIENGEGRALTFGTDPATGRPRSDASPHAPRLIEAMRSG